MEWWVVPYNRNVPCVPENINFPQSGKFGKSDGAVWESARRRSGELWRRRIRRWIRGDLFAWKNQYFVSFLFLFCSFGILEDPIDGFKDMWLQRTISVVCTGPKMSINIFWGIDNCLYYRHTLQYTSLIRKPGFPNLQWQIRWFQRHLQKFKTPKLQTPKTKRVKKEHTSTFHMHTMICKISGNAHMFKLKLRANPRS